MTVLLAAFIFCLYLTGLFLTVKQLNVPDNKKVRQYISQITSSLSEDNYIKIDGIKYAVFSLSGNVDFSDIENYDKDTTVDLKTLSVIDGTRENGFYLYSAPIINGGVQTGVLLLSVEGRLVSNHSFLYIFLIIIQSAFFILVIFILVRQFAKVKNEIAIPILQINTIAKKMLAGNLDEKLLYDYTDEIGELCHNIENLRDELNASRDREITLKKNEKFLLACISHDLKTPIAVISGNAESLRDGIIEKKSATETIINKSKQLSKLIDDILQHTKAELDEFVIELKECYAKEFFETECNELKNEVEKNGIIFLAKICPNCLVKIDKQRIAQVMQNLVSNSIKYTGKNGLIEIDFTIENNFLIVSVKDSGQGISAEDMPFIFDKFFRGEKARNMNTGSGLGLAISKHIIEKHQGTIEVDSSPNRGTKISFSLPLTF